MKKFAIENADNQIWSQHKNINHSCPFWGTGENAILFDNKYIANREFDFYEIPENTVVVEFDEENSYPIS